MYYFVQNTLLKYFLPQCIVLLSDLLFHQIDMRKDTIAQNCIMQSVKCNVDQSWIKHAMQWSHYCIKHTVLQTIKK